MTGFSQYREKPVISFVSRGFDFGNIKEETGKVTHDFVFTNTGKAPLVIQQVTASCGCTTPSWTKQPIAPRAKGKITVTYSATGRPETFTKTITVNNNSTESIVQLSIHGTVIAQPLSQAQAFPIAFGKVKLKSTIIPLGEMHKGEKKVMSIPVLNTSDSSITLSIGNLPKHITASVQPKTLSPGQKGSIQFSCNTSLINEWGFRSDKVVLVGNNDVASSKNNVLTITGFISEDFSKLTPAQKVATPVAALLTKQVSLGKIKCGETVKGKFEIRNTGKSPLIIRKIFSDCNCITAQLPQQGIAVGQTATISFSVRTGTSIGQKIENVNLMTNSPATTDLQLPVSWETIR
ncbi:DUF1573 domain-containing protein [Paludibacter sp.]|uniref:DUF1573 domain-containing protein n=1 Tax=Paludibacter sp. TaxID=1898105 RepID=UPI0025CE79C5|nr:DUF1573 domain-containing protein [Paludibacter sp.]